MAFVQAQGVRFGHDEAGSGPPVVLGHAGIADRRLWTGPFDALAAGTVVVNGLDDIPAVHQIADRLTAGIPAAHRIDLPDTGHLPPLERPAEVTAAITDLLHRVAR